MERQTRRDRGSVYLMKIFCHDGIVLWINRNHRRAKIWRVLWIGQTTSRYRSERRMQLQSNVTHGMIKRRALQNVQSDDIAVRYHGWERYVIHDCRMEFETELYSVSESAHCPLSSITDNSTLNGDIEFSRVWTYRSKIDNWKFRIIDENTSKQTLTLLNEKTKIWADSQLEVTRTALEILRLDRHARTVETDTWSLESTLSFIIRIVVIRKRLKREVGSSFRIRSKFCGHQVIIKK